MHPIDLSKLTDQGRVRNLSGHERGLEARRKFDLANHDKNGVPVEVRVPGELNAITISFFQGMFAESVKKAGSETEFLRRYRFHASPAIMKQILRGINLISTQRDVVLG